MSADTPSLPNDPISNDPVPNDPISIDPVSIDEIRLPLTVELLRHTYSALLFAHNEGTFHKLDLIDQQTILSDLLMLRHEISTFDNQMKSVGMPANSNTGQS